MSFKIAEHTLSADVGDTDTFTVGYPAGRDAGFYRNTFDHKVVTEQSDVYNHPADFTLTFGTSNITVTWANARTLESGTKVFVQLEERGNGEHEGGLLDTTAIVRVRPVHRVELNLGAPDVADANGYVESQDLTAAGVFSVDTTAAAAIADAALAGEADVPRNVVAAWTGTAVLTVTGTDEYGNVMVESSASGTSLTGKKAFKTVTGIATSANITALTVGTGDVLGLPIFVPAMQNVAAEFQSGVGLARFDNGKIIIPIQINQTDLLAATAQQFNAPCAGYITGIRGVCQAAITTGGAVTVAANTTDVVGLSITLANSDAAGVTYTDDVLKIASGLCAAGDDCQVKPAAAIDTGGALNVEIIFEPIPELNGTLVAGVTDAPTATTGDVRGTYDPAEVCNGTLEFSLFVDVTDPAALGLDQFAG